MAYSYKIATTFEEAQALATRLLESNIMILGCDTETTTERKEDAGKVSLIQLATPTEIHLYQIYRIMNKSSAFPSQLKKVLCSDSIIKVGVALSLDVERIQSSYDLNMKGWVDLQPVAITMKIPTSSLNDLCKKFLTDYTEKDPLGHQGNWDTDLDGRQVHYACSDAYNSLRLYHSMVLREELKSIIAESADDSHLLLQWIRYMLESATTNRSVSSLVNQVVNSYGPWRNRYVLSDRREKAEKMIQMFIEKGELPYDPLRQEIIISNRPTMKPISLPDVIITEHDILDITTKFKLTGMKSSSVRNILLNSYGPWSGLPDIGDRVNKALSILRDRKIITS